MKCSLKSILLLYSFNKANLSAPPNQFAEQNGPGGIVTSVAKSGTDLMEDAAGNNDTMGKAIVKDAYHFK